MALIPHKADPNYEQQMEERKLHPERWGAAAWQNVNYDTPLARVMRRLAAHYGLSSINAGTLNLAAEKLLTDAKGIEAKVDIESARATLIERGMLS